MPQQAQGIVLANEVLDALPVDLLYRDKHGKLTEQKVGLTDNQLVFKDVPPAPSLVSALKSRNIPLYTDYRYELNQSAPAFFSSLASCLDEGLCFFFDYGYPRKD